MLKDKKSTFLLKKIVFVSLGLVVSINVGVNAFNIDMGNMKTVLNKDYIKISNIDKAEEKFDVSQSLNDYTTIVEKVEKKQEPVPYETHGSDTDGVVVQEGQDGIKEITYKVKYENGVEISRTEISTAIIAEPVAKVIERQFTASLASRSGTASERTGDAGDYQAYARSRMADYAWSDYDFECLVELWARESGWNPTAGNSYSGAYGIPQALPASKMSSYGDDYLTNYETQINWGLSYISSRYGSPSNAWEHFQNANWY